jgi:hypothetical protein
LAATRGGFGMSVAASNGVPLFATGVPTFTATTGTGNFVRAADPVLTGNPTAPTPAVGDNDTSIATTAFVRANAAPFDAMAYSGVQINGGMEVSQELGATGINSVSGSRLNICDGFSVFSGGVMVVNAKQAALNVNGFANCLTATVTTAQTSLSSTDFLTIMHYIEGYRVSRLQWGAANAQPLTIGFWSSHHRTGLYSVGILNPAFDRSYDFTYSQAVADTLQYNVATVPGCINGTWPKDNTAGILVSFTVCAGTSYTGSAANTWMTGAYLAAPGQVNGVAATSDVFRITGVTVLPGTQAPTAAQSPNIMRPYDQELVTCQRYYCRFPGYISNSFNAPSTGFNYFTQFYWPVEMRATPTVACNFLGVSNISAYAFQNISPQKTEFYATASAAGGGAISVQDLSANARL